MSEQVTYQTRLWSQEVALGEARDALETTAQPFPLKDRREIAYEFSGRIFRDGLGPYQP